MCNQRIRLYAVPGVLKAIGEHQSDDYMRIQIAGLFAAVWLVVCSTQLPIPPANGIEMAGSYYRGDHTGYNIYLDLLAGGEYTAKWRGCLGVYGTARGRWTMVKNRMVFSPSSETGMMKRHLRQLHVVYQQ